MTKEQVVACAGKPSGSYGTTSGETLTYHYSGAGDDLLLGHADIGLGRIEEGALQGRPRRLTAARAKSGDQNRQQ